MRQAKNEAGKEASVIYALTLIIENEKQLTNVMKAPKRLFFRLLLNISDDCKYMKN